MLLLLHTGRKKEFCFTITKSNKICIKIKVCRNMYFLNLGTNWIRCILSLGCVYFVGLKEKRNFFNIFCAIIWIQQLQILQNFDPFFSSVYVPPKSRIQKIFFFPLCTPRLVRTIFIQKKSSKIFQLSSLSHSISLSSFPFLIQIQSLIYLGSYLQS